jgi:hypothetical protein
MTPSYPKAIKSTLVTEYSDGSSSTVTSEVPHRVAFGEKFHAGEYNWNGRLIQGPSEYAVALDHFENDPDHDVAYMVELTPPPSPFAVDDIIQLPAKYNSPGQPHKKSPSFWQIATAEFDFAYSRMWRYTAVDRDGANTIGISGDTIADLTKVDDWPYRAGDFVEIDYVDGKAVRKLLKRAKAGDKAYLDPNGSTILYNPAAEGPAWWHQREDGRIGWDLESTLGGRVEVHVSKTEKWIKKIDVNLPS